jgi:hypothetical protein
MMDEHGQVEALERRLRDAESRAAAETGALRAELARARAHEAGGPEREYPRLGRMLLEYQVPTVILVVVGSPGLPLTFFMIVPVAVILLLAGLLGWALERRLARAPRAPSLAVTLVRHQLLAGLLLQTYVVGGAYVLAGVSFLRPAGFRMEEFLTALAIGEAAYVIGVVLPLWLITARRAHAQHLRRWPGPLT